MALYRFTVGFEDYEDVSRVIEIRSTQSFYELHIAIQDAIGFDKSQLASFYISDDSWRKGMEITLERMTEIDPDDPDYLPVPTMKEARLCDYINDPHQRFVYVFDFLEMWTLQVELTGIIIQEDPKKTYPALIRSVGAAPKQYADKKFTLVDDDELGEITSKYGIETEEGIDEEEAKGIFDSDDSEDEQEGSETSENSSEDYY